MSFFPKTAARAASPARPPTVKGMVVDVSAEDPSWMQASGLALAAAELKAVLNETAVATNAILDSAERIRAAAATLPSRYGSALTAEGIRILEACTFEDITGQRITKVVRLLEEAQSRASGRQKTRTSGVTAQRIGDAGLLNGPQLPSVAWTQADIDAMVEGEASRRGKAKRKRASR